MATTHERLSAAEQALDFRAGTMRPALVAVTLESTALDAVKARNLPGPHGDAEIVALNRGEATIFCFRAVVLPDALYEADPVGFWGIVEDLAVKLDRFGCRGWAGRAPHADARPILPVLGRTPSIPLAWRTLNSELTIAAGKLGGKV